MSPSFKVVIVGAESSGKTSIVKRMFGRQVSAQEESTVSVECQDLSILIQSLNTKVNFELYDLPGSERYMVLNRMYLRDTNAALIVYDATNRDSMQAAEAWMQELRETAPEQCIVAVTGNKLDASNKQVGMQDGQAFARKHNLKIVSEVSAKTGESVDSLFQKLAVACYENKDNFVSGLITFLFNDHGF